MWGKLLTLIFAFLPWLIEKLRREEVEKELKQDQEKADEKAIQDANTLRDNTGDDPNLLLAPGDRASHNID